MIRQFIIDALWLSVELTAIPLGAAALAGLVIAILQAVTQVQEQTSVYVVKLAAVSVAIFAMRLSIEEQFLSLMRSVGVLIAGGGGELTW